MPRAAGQGSEGSSFLPVPIAGFHTDGGLSGGGMSDGLLSPPTRQVALHFMKGHFYKSGVTASQEIQKGRKKKAVGVTQW